ncbi:hypothetical protein Tco_0398246 [Tanacetum coccineum]
MAALKYKDDHNKIAYLGRERGCEDFTDILSYLDQSPLRYALTHDPPVVFDSLVKQFWATAVVRPNAAGSHDLVATIDGRENSQIISAGKTKSAGWSKGQPPVLLVDSFCWVIPSTDMTIGTQETNINAGTKDSDSSESEVVEQIMQQKIELAKLQRQEYEAEGRSCTIGYLGSCLFVMSISAWLLFSAGSDSAGGNPAGSFQPAVSYEPAGQGNPAVSTSVSADFIPVHADESTLPPGQSLGSSENNTRFPVPSDCYSYKFSPAVEVNPVPIKRVNTIHPQSQILGDLASPVLTRSRAQNPNLVKVLSLDMFKINKGSILTDNFIMQQFINQKVWNLVPLPHGKHAIGTKWILKNKRDARGIVMMYELPFSMEKEEIEGRCGYVTQPNGFFERSLTSQSMSTKWLKFGWAFLKAPRAPRLCGLLLLQKPSMLLPDSCCAQSTLDRTIAGLWIQLPIFDVPQDLSNLVVHIGIGESLFYEFEGRGISEGWIVVNTAASGTFFLLDALFLLVAMDYADGSVFMLVGILLLVDLFLLIGDLFLLSQLSLCCAQFDIATGWSLPLSKMIITNRSLTGKGKRLARTSRYLSYLGTLSIKVSTLDSAPPVPLLNGREVVVTRSLIRTSLHFDDVNGIFDMPNSDILEGMRAIGYPTDRALTFLKNHLSPQWRFLVHTLMHCLSPKSGSWNQFPSSIATALLCLSTGRRLLETEPPRPTFGFTRKLFANMKFKWEGQPIPLTPPMLAIAAAGDDAADEEMLFQ